MLISAIVGAEWLDSGLGHFTPWKIYLVTHYVGGWVRDCLDVLGKRKCVAFAVNRNQIPQSSSL